MLLNNAFIDCDAKQGDRLLKLVEFVWLVIIRTLLPNCSQFSGGDWDFKVFAELIVALKSKHDQVVSYLAEVASLISILATVEIEHFKEVLVNDFLFFRSHRGGRSDIVGVFFNVDLLLYLWLFNLLWLLHQLHFLCWLFKLFKIYKDDAAASLEKIFELSKDKVSCDFLFIKDKRIGIKNSLIRKLDKFLAYYSTFVSVFKAGFDKLSWPLSLFCSYDGLKLRCRLLSRGYEMRQTDMFVQLGQAFRVVEESLASLVLRACFDHYTASDQGDLQPDFFQFSQRDLVWVRRIHPSEDFPNFFVMEF